MPKTTSKIVKKQCPYKVEAERCIRSPYYFFINYYKGQTDMSELEFNNKIKLI